MNCPIHNIEMELDDISQLDVSIYSTVTRVDSYYASNGDIMRYPRIGFAADDNMKYKYKCPYGCIFETVFTNHSEAHNASL